MSFLLASLSGLDGIIAVLVVYVVDPLAAAGLREAPRPVVTYLYERGARGDVVRIYDKSGSVAAEYAYDAYGNCEVLADAGGIASLNPFRYRGYYYDEETGLYYLNARYYDPSLGRFLSPDSLSYLDPSAAEGMNLFAYCQCDPVNKVDPTGHFPFLALLIGAVILLFTPIGGAILQTAASVLCYGGMAVASLFNSDVRADMDAIGWNPFNTDESAVLNSSYVSFYKGVPVFRTDGFVGRYGTFLGIFLNRSNYDTDTVRHEWGHVPQQMILGPVNFGLLFAIPSANQLSTRPYYERPWEITADIMGGASRTHASSDIDRGWSYLVASLFFGPFAYLFLLGEY